MRRRIRVLVADDSPEVLSALVSVLDDDPRFTVAATAASGPEAVHLAAASPVDVVLLDIHMPGGGSEPTEQIAALPDAPAVVAISAQSGSRVVEEMLRAGAVGYFTKGRIGGSLPDLLARCVDGEVVLATPEAAAAMRSLLRTPVPR